MYIRKTTPEDLERILEIYVYARKFMAETGNPHQWGHNNWPPEEILRNDIAIGKSYVCVDDETIVGTFYFDMGDDIDPTYRVIENGTWGYDMPYGVVHRIASSGTTKGVGTKCIRWALDQAGYIRIDTHGDNVVMQNLLTKLGFTKRGIIHVKQDTDDRVAFDMKIN